MKDRLKKFYKEYEDVVNGAALFALGCTMVAIGVHGLNKQLNGMTIDEVRARNLPDNEIGVTVFLKNGTSLLYTGTPS